MATEWISRNAVFAALDMCAVLEHYQIQYQSSVQGPGIRIRCPFHDDHRPSCSVNIEQKVYNCFGCDAQGNVLDFIASMEDLDAQREFRVVLEVALDILGFNPSPPRARNAGSSHRGSSGSNQAEDKTSNQIDDGDNETDGNVSQDNASDTHVSSNEGGDQSSASKDKASKNSRPEKPQRKLKREVPPNKVLEGPAFPLKLESNHEFLVDRGFDGELLEEFGIGFETRSNALMAGRICFPIHNARGELVAYAGRWAGTETNAEGEYIDSKGRVQERYKLPKGFAKQLELYNLHRVLQQYPNRKQVRATKLHVAKSHETKAHVARLRVAKLQVTKLPVTKLLVVEGFWSVLRLHSLIRSKQKTKGRKNDSGTAVIALMGRTISRQQIKLLKIHGFQTIVLMLDGDDEGRKATKSILPKLARHFFVKDAYLPDGTKPDDVDEKFLMKFVGSKKPRAQKGKPKSQKGRKTKKTTGKHSDTNLDTPKPSLNDTDEN